MIELHVEQRSPEWFVAKTGVLSGSVVAQGLTPTGKVSQSKQYQRMVRQLAAETILGEIDEIPQTMWMTRGIELEPEARRTYEFLTGNTVRETGLCYLDSTKRIGCSPDGLIDPDGVYETKSPKPEKHIEYLLNGVVPAEYMPQVQFNLYVTGRKWLDFMSYCPEMKPLIVRCTPDVKFQASIEELCASVLTDVDNIIREVTA
jgi:hypothetical protein